MKRKSIKIITTTLLLSTMLSFSSLAGWEQSETGWKYKNDTTNVYVTSTWIESATEKGLWYYIGTDGVMATNTIVDGVYYVNDKGEWRDTTGESTGTSNESNINVPDNNNSNNGINWGDPNEIFDTTPDWGVDGVIVG